MNYYLLDVFTDTRFCGNPLAVFPNADSLSDAQMQRIAGELNLSETTFIQSKRLETSDCTVRIFTPQKELPMAGHPTIGTAFTILKHGLLRPQHSDYLLFDEGVGPVRVDYTIDEASQPTDIVMHQPMPAFGETLGKHDIAKLLSIDSSDIEENVPVRIVSCGVPIIFVPLTSLDAVRRASVRLDLLDTVLEGIECRELFIFTMETESPDADVHCRFFAPRLGVPEDPATGGAHGPLGSYLVHYGMSDGRRIVSEQGFEMGRPSILRVRIESSGTSITGVFVGGDCAEVGTGNMQTDTSRD